VSWCEVEEEKKDWHYRIEPKVIRKLPSKEVVGAAKEGSQETVWFCVRCIQRSARGRRT